MQRIKDLFDDDNAVSPVIGVILMVAITVILAAVIASFVIGLGDQNDPAPTPSFDTDYTDTELTFTKSGGDDFETSPAELQWSINASNSTSGFVDEDGTIEDITASSEPINDTTKNIKVEYNPSLTGDEMTAGDSFAFEAAGTDTKIESWTVEVVWNPDGGDSEIIYTAES